MIGKLWTALLHKSLTLILKVMRIKRHSCQQFDPYSGFDVKRQQCLNEHRLESYKLFFCKLLHLFML